MNDETLPEQSNPHSLHDTPAPQQELETLAVPIARDDPAVGGVGDFGAATIADPTLTVSTPTPCTVPPIAIFNLPADIWIRIVEYLTLASQNILALQRSVLALSRTSSQLREMCLHTPQLWSTLNIGGGSKPEIVTAFLARSSAAPLHVEFSCFGPPDAVRNEILTHFNHTRTLSIFIGSGLADHWELVSKLFQQPAPLLRWLLIQDTTGSGRSLPTSPETHWLHIRTLSLRGISLDETKEYPALHRITRLQYTEPGRLTRSHLAWIFGQCTSLEQFGTYADAGVWDFSGDPAEPVEPPASLHLVQFGDVYGSELTNVLSFFSRVPTIRARPEDVSRYNVLAAYPRIPPEPWTHLQQMNCRGRRGIAKYRTRPIRIGGADTETRANSLQLYVRRDEMIKMLQTRPSADSLSLLTLDEGAWDFFANQSRCSRENPLVLPGLTTMRITFMPCIYEKFYYPDIYGSCGVWPNPQVFSLIDLPCLEELHLVHMTSWTCQRVRYQRALKICQCHNNGIVSVTQVVDLLKHRVHGIERRIPKLAIFGVTDILDEDPRRNSAALAGLVDSVEWSWSVPGAFVEEDAQIGDFHNQLVRGWFEPDVDSIRFS